MISANFFHQVSERISKAKAWDPTSSGKPFGGVNLVIMDDIGQLPPVNMASLFSHKLVNKIKANISETNSGQESLNGAFLWRQLNKAVELKSNIRAKHDQPFINLLVRIRQGNSWNGIKGKTDAQIGTGKNYTESDYQVLLSR
jgi:hypothetical protein